jgi:hypothetical protein
MSADVVTALRLADSVALDPHPTITSAVIAVTARSLITQRYPGTAVPAPVDASVSRVESVFGLSEYAAVREHPSRRWAAGTVIAVRV